MTTESQVCELYSPRHETHARIERALQTLPMSHRVTVLGFAESMVDDAALARNHLSEGIAKGVGDYLTGYAAALFFQYGWAQRAGAPELIEKHGQ